VLTGEAAQIANFQLQDILNSRTSIAELEELNEAGRSKLSAIRRSIERLDDWARDTTPLNQLIPGNKKNDSTPITWTANVSELLQRQRYLYTQHPLRHFLSAQMQAISQLEQYYIKS